METQRRSAEVQEAQLEVKHRVMIRTIVDRFAPAERAELVDFFETLLERRNAPLSRAKKLMQVMIDPRVRRAAVVLLDRTAAELKDLAWDDRTWVARLGLTAATVAAIPTAGQGAGIAALGTAIGVPLWVVFGAGGAFAGAMIEELKNSLPDGGVPRARYEPGAALVHIPEAEYELLEDQLDAATEYLVRAIDEEEESESEASGRLGRVRQALRRSRLAVARLRRRIARD